MNKVIFSFFSGCGILDLGFEKSGYDICLVNEFSPAFMEAYKYSRSQMGILPPRYGYINRDVNCFLDECANELANHITTERASGNLVGFIGGPPCPDFSIAGSQKGRDGDHGKLSQSYINLILMHKPDFFLFENVKGLWRTAKHRAYYEELKLELQNGGYILFDRLTNALEFGAPQDRDRILLVGFRNDVFPELTQKAFPWKKHMLYDLAELRMIDWPLQNPYVEDSHTNCPVGIPEEITVEYWFKRNDVEHHPDANRYFVPRAGLPKFQSIAEGDSNKKSYKRIHRWRYSPTVCYGNNEVHLHPYKSRRLSVAESMSLQSLPKEFCLPPTMTLSNCFKTIGNGVPFLLAQGVAKTISDFIDDNPTSERKCDE